MKYDVLIIDDEKELADNTCDYLNMFNINSYVCYSKEEYTEFFKENNASLILLDINLKDGSGFDICKEIRKDKDIVINEVNGKLNNICINNYIDKIKSIKDEDKDSIIEKALNEENVQKHLEGKEVIKTIVVPNKIVNIVVK